MTPGMYMFLPESNVVTFGVVGKTRAPCALDHLLPSPRAHSCADACPDPMEKTYPLTPAPSRYLRTPFLVFSLPLMPPWPLRLTRYIALRRAATYLQLQISCFRRAVSARRLEAGATERARGVVISFECVGPLPVAHP